MSWWHVRMGVHVLRAGGVIAYPTESVYGIGCDPRRVEAVERVLGLKRRPAEKGMILIASTMSQLEGFVRLSRKLNDRIFSTWPGPVTWVLPAGPLAPPWITGSRGTVAVRVTAHPEAAGLCRGFGGPLVSTSANLAGRRPARTAMEARLRISLAGVDYLVPGETGTCPRPTEIRDGRTGKVLREG